MTHIIFIIFLIVDAQIPVILSSPNSSRDLSVKTGVSVQWKCYVQGMPPPTIVWFKVSCEDYFLIFKNYTFNYTFRMDNCCT